MTVGRSRWKTAARCRRASSSMPPEPGPIRSRWPAGSHRCISPRSSARWRNCGCPRRRRPRCRWCSIWTSSSISSPNPPACGSAPHDESPSPPCDAAADDIDVALAIARLEQVVDWQVERVEHRWAGLRSFAPDRLPVYGFDRQAQGFFWFAGQGGFGIQTAPAASELAVRLLIGSAGGQIDPQPYHPARFAHDASTGSA